MTDRPSAGALFRGLYAYVAMVLGLGTLALLCLGWLPFAMLLHPLLPRRHGKWLGRRVISFGFRLYLGILSAVCGCRFDLAALDALRDEEALILAANHPSLLDAVLIVSRLPNAVCVMKAALLDNLLFGAAARLAAYIRNNAPLEMILSAREELHSGAHLVIFPEGTRTAAFPLDPCSPSVGLIAGRAKVPVQTLVIEFSSPYLGKAWPLFRPPLLPLEVRIRLGRRFPPQGNAQRLTSELETHLRGELHASPTFMDVAIVAV